METEQNLRKENIAEYLLYMWQMEDLARAFLLDEDRMASAVLPNGGDESQRARIAEICGMMRQEGLQESGHLQVNKNIILDLEELHQVLLSSNRYATYSAAWIQALPSIRLLQQKAGELRKGDLETCFDALYGTLLLRLQGKETSKETQDALQAISNLIARLCAYYPSYKEDKLEL